MGKKTKKRPRWRRLSLEDAEAVRSPSPGPSEADGSGPHRDKPRPRTRNAYARSHSVTTYVFDEDEYTKIQTPRQDMIFKKSAFTKRRAPTENSLCEEPERQASTGPDQPTPPPECPRHPPPRVPAGAPGCVPAGCPPPALHPPGAPPVVPPPPPATSVGPSSEATSTGTPELSEVSSESKSTSECGDGSEPAKDALTALASQIQYAFIDPQGNVYFNVMDEAGIIHLPPVAGYYMAPSFPGGPMIATPVPWQAVPIAPLDSPEYQALLAQQRKQQQPLQQQQLQQLQQQQLQQLQQQQLQQLQPPQQLQRCQEVATDEGSCGSRPRSALSDLNSAPATSGAGSRPRTPTPTPTPTPAETPAATPPPALASPTLPDSPPAASPARRASSGHEQGDAELDNRDSAPEDSKARRVKKKKKKQKKKAHSVDSGITDDGSDGSREVALTASDSGATFSSDCSAYGGGRLTATTAPARPERSPSEQTSGVQSDVSLPDSPQRRPSGEPAPPQLTSQPDVCVLHGAATALCRHLTMAPPATTATPPPSPTSAPAVTTKNDVAAVSCLEAAILSQLQQKASASIGVATWAVSGAAAASAPAGATTCDTLAPPLDQINKEELCEEEWHHQVNEEAVDDTNAAVDATDAGDDAESCDSFVYEDKSGDVAEWTAAPAEVATVPDSWADNDHASEFGDESQPRPAFTDLTMPVDLRRTVILEETESERDRESSPGSAASDATGDSPIKEPTPELSPDAVASSSPATKDVAITLPVKDVVIPSDVQYVISSVERDAKPGQLELNDVIVDEIIEQTAVVSVATALSSSNTGKQSLQSSEDERLDEPACKSLSQLEEQVHSADVGSSNPELPLPKSVPDTAVAPSLSDGSQQSALSPAGCPQSDCEGSPPPGDPPPPPDPGTTASPTSSLSEKSISSAVRGWLQQQAPGAVFVVADDSDADIASDNDWESDEDVETQQTGPKNVQGNPSPVACSDAAAAAGERVASRVPGPCCDCQASPAALRLVDLDAGAVLTLPLHTAPAASADSAASSDSESLAPPALLRHARCGGADPAAASLASELMEAGCIHRESDRRLIGDSAFLSAALAPADGADAADEADEGYGGSPLSSPEVRRESRPARLVRHPLRHVQTETPAPWGICCSLQ